MTTTPVAAAPLTEHIRTRFLFSLEVDAALDRTRDIGPTPLGRRIIVPIVGGRFTGPELKGTVLDGGAGYTLVRPDGVKQFEIRLVLQTHDHHLVALQYTGLTRAAPDVMARLNQWSDVPFDDYYIRTRPVFEAGAGPYGWLNDIVAIAQSEKRPTGIVHHVFELQ